MQNPNPENPNPEASPSEKLTYEEAFDSLEKILEELNEGKASLADSLSLFENANKLIEHCSSQLNNAEKKIETLIKKRDGQLIYEDQKPKTEAFSHFSEDVLSQNENDI